MTKVEGFESQIINYIIKELQISSINNTAALTTLRMVLSAAALTTLRMVPSETNI